MFVFVFFRVHNNAKTHHTPRSARGIYVMWRVSFRGSNTLHGATQKLNRIFRKTVAAPSHPRTALQRHRGSLASPTMISSHLATMGRLRAMAAYKPVVRRNSAGSSAASHAAAKAAAATAAAAAAALPSLAAAEDKDVPISLEQCRGFLNAYVTCVPWLCWFCRRGLVGVVLCSHHGFLVWHAGAWSNTKA